MGPGIEVIKLEYNLKLKIKRNDWLLRTRVRKQPIITLYFEIENELQFYNIRPRDLTFKWVSIKFVLSYMRISNTKNVLSK